LKSVAKTGLAVLAARLSSFLLFVLAARSMSATDSAGLIYVVGISQLVVQIGTLGWLNLIRRMAARLDIDHAEIRKGFFVRASQIPITAVALVCVALVCISQIGIFEPDLSKAILYTALVSVPVLFNLLMKELLAGMNFPTRSVFLSDALPFAVTLGLLWTTGRYELGPAVAYLVVGYMISIVAQSVVTVPKLKSIMRSTTARYRTLDWTRIAALTAVGFGGKMLMDRLDSLLIAPLVGLYQLTYFNAASRLASLLLLVPIVLIPVFAPRISRAFHDRNTPQMRVEIFIQLAVILMTIVPPAIILFLFPHELVSLIFGPTYSAAGDVMRLVLLAQLIFAFSLPFSNLLLMTDGEISYAISGIVGFLTNLSAGLVLIPKYGIVGAAEALLAGTAAVSIIVIVSGINKLRLTAASSPLGVSHL
jgi:O-antigen/teichoic acid export membrane protein